MLLREKGIETRPFFYPIHKQPLYKFYNKISLPYTERIASQGINLPSSVKLKKKDIEIISNALKSVLN